MPGTASCSIESVIVRVVRQEHVWVQYADQEQGRPPKKKKQKKTTDTDLAEFEAEIAAIEDGQADEVCMPRRIHAVAAETSNRYLEEHLLTGKLVQGSPPPEERTFVDDDGTKFVWDSALRKFCPEDMVTPQAASAGTQQQQKNPPATSQGGAGTAGEYTQVLILFKQVACVVTVCIQQFHNACSCSAFTQNSSCHWFSLIKNPSNSICCIKNMPRVLSTVHLLCHARSETRFRRVITFPGSGACRT